MLGALRLESSVISRPGTRTLVRVTSRLLSSPPLHPVLLGKTDNQQ